MQKVIGDVLQKLSRRCPEASFAVEFWDGKSKHYGPGAEEFKMTLRSEGTIKKILSGGTLAFGEEYMAGNIMIEGDIQKMVMLYDQWQAVAGKLSLPTITRILWNRAFSRHTIGDSGKNVRRHYDISNDFYSLWLDPAMVYSCAYFKSDADDLETAQNNKHEHICRKLQLKAGETLVDIGCGWGGMMFYAAKNYGAVCTGYTLSKNQYDYVSEKIKKEGLEGKVNICLQDYRKIKGTFDKFVSVGMFEHVGKRYEKKFFAVVKKILKPGGIGLLHTIGSAAGGATDPWIARYIFPGGYIPTLSLAADNMSRAGLVFYDVEDLRMHYARTLDLWIRNYETNIEQIKKTMSAQLRDEIAAEQFMRMWRLYLNGSAVSFKTAGNRLYQIVFTNGANNDLPLTRDYIYRI
jgi:cyclopropane-fatty-acyl-phospholipid synthase